MTEPRVVVVGIGADGWDGLTSSAREAVTRADVVLGGERHLAMVRGHVPGRLAPLPSPLLPGLSGALRPHAGRRLCMLASGDPMFFGIGSTIVRLLGSDGVEIVPSVSSVSLACARLGWPVDEVAVVSSVGRPRELLHPAIQPGRRVLVLTTGRDAADGIARMLCERGFGPSRVTVLERLGAPDERRCAATARDWRSVDGHDPLAVVAVDCVPGRGADVLPTVPGLPDSAYRGDGQLTKREVRAVTLAALGPLPGQTLWDVGAGTGTIGIEWMRSQPGCHAVAVEPRPDRASTIAANAAALGVPGIDVVVGAAPAALAGLPRPDAVFVGGGVSTAGVVDACLAALGAGGRLVANAVTVEAEVALAGWRARLGGDLVRVSVSRAAGLGSFTAWRPAMPVTQWSYSRERTG